MSRGSLNDFDGAMILLTYERCTSEERPTCKSDEEFDTWMKTKVLSLAHNDQKFMIDEFGDAAFKTELKMDIMIIDSQEPLLHEVKMKTTKVTTSDSYLGSFVSPETNYIVSPKL